MHQARRPKQPTHDATKEKAGKTSSSSISDKKKKKLSIPQVPSVTTVHKLTKQQAAELLKVFWVELLQNNVRQVRKMLVANLHSLDFRAAKYAPAADGSALHLCAQHGLIAMAQLLVDMKVVDLNAQSKVGSTPLHVACKFGQEAMLLFLLELGVRVDIPDSVSWSSKH
jgi:ankyrin repeat protein